MGLPDFVRATSFAALLASVALLLATPATAASCKRDYSTCAQVVRTWCEGRHPRADGDNDGIPCENLCRSKSQVDELRRQYGSCRP